MAVFDAKAFAAVAGNGGGPVEAVGTAFGVPSCMINLANDLLNLLPSEILQGIKDAMLEGVTAADDVVKSIVANLFGWMGIIEWDTEEGGFVFRSKASKLAAEKSGVLGVINGFLKAAAFASRLYENYQTARSQIESMYRCIKDFQTYLKYANGNAANEVSNLTDVQYDEYIDTLYNNEKQQMMVALDFIDQCNAQIELIDGILDDRRNNPNLEPSFLCEFYSELSGTGLRIECDPATQKAKEIFRLVYGPPKSTYGQFILSKDGLYFDSQTNGIYPALNHLFFKQAAFPKGDKWKFKQDPNIGGRGDSFSTNDLKLYVNTILDPSKIDESESLKDYYNSDALLQELLGNKNKRIYDLSSQLSELIEGNAPTSIITNFKQAMISESLIIHEKINKRKKQIELAVVLPRIYGTNIEYQIGKIPINDFSYLAGLNISLDLQKQKALTFSQVDISGVVSPLETTTPIYSVPKVNTKNTNFEHLIIAENGAGAIIYDGSSVSSTDAVVLQAENVLTTDSLFAMYNFLDTDIESPSSTVFSSRNSASQSTELYGQLVAESQSDVFERGLGVPYFQGITKHSNTLPGSLSGLGSFFRLPNERQFNDLLYNNTGASIDFWVHVNNLSSIANGYNVGNVSSLYRLVLSNENTGSVGDVNTNTEYISNDFSNKHVRGFMMGFTRDRRLTKGLPASEIDSNNPASGTVFFIAPTQSVTASSVALINRSAYDSQDCNVGTKYHSMTYPISSIINGVALSACQNTFCHVAVTFDPKEDSINFFVDGKKVQTSSMSYVFGIEPNHMPNLPTAAAANSFEYNSYSVGSSAPNSLKYGPKFDAFRGPNGVILKYTPWIVGGGYTDGLYNKGNFMGGKYGGIISGLRGHLGSIKFYSKPLNSSEIINNYNTQKNFFKNIDTSKLS